jgi:hypothetical protein
MGTLRAQRCEMQTIEHKLASMPARPAWMMYGEDGATGYVVVGEPNQAALNICL